MSEFNKFRVALQKQFDKLSNNGNLYQALIEKDIAWDTYLASFPQGTNPIFRERTEHNCMCCKRFVRNLGRAIA